MNSGSIPNVNIPESKQISGFLNGHCGFRFQITILKALNEKLSDTIEDLSIKKAQQLEEKFQKLDDDSKQGFKSLAEMINTLLFEEQKNQTLNLIAKNDKVAYLVYHWVNERITTPHSFLDIYKGNGTCLSHYRI